MDWIVIRKEYESTEISLKDLATKHGISEGTMRSRKNREKWQRSGETGTHEATRNATGNATQRTKQRATEKKNVATQSVTPKRKSKSKAIVNNREIEFEENFDLTEKQRLFCLYYIKSYNATMSAIKAGYAKNRAHITGSELVRNSKVGAEIRRLKGRALQELFIDALDVLEVYAKIAFANITEYTDFGQRDVPVMNMFGPVYEGEGKDKKAVLKTVNFVDIKPSAEIDGTLISEVKQGKDGVSIKLYDKMKALEKLELYLDLLPDKHKRRIEDERLKIEQAKFEAEQKKIKGSDDEIQDDNFLEAMKSGVANIWSDEVPDKQTDGETNG